MATGNLLAASGWRRLQLRIVAAILVLGVALAMMPEASAAPRTGYPVPRSGDAPRGGAVHPSQLGDTTPMARDNPVAPRVKIDVMVVYANQSGTVDPRLRELQRQLEMMKFTGFQVLSTHSAQLSTNQSTTVPVAGGRKMEITLVSFDDQAATVRIQQFRGNEKLNDSRISIHRGRTLITGGPKYQDGSLIVPISVTY